MGWPRRPVQLLLLAPVVVCAAGVWACGSSPSEGSSPDAGADSSTHGAGADSGSSAEAGSSAESGTAADGGAGSGDSATTSDSATASDSAAPGDSSSSNDGGAPVEGGSPEAGKDSGVADSGSASEAGTVGGVPGGQAGPGTTLSGCSIFPTDNPWNVAVNGASVQVIHTYDAQLAQTTSLHPDLGGYTSNIGGIPINVVAAGQAELSTIFSVSANQSDPGPGGWVGSNPNTTGSDTGTTAYPFFVGMKIEGNPAAGGTPGNLPDDQHGLVLEQGTGGCTSYEAWNCVVVSSAPFRCANGAVFNLTSNALRPAGWTSADAAGLSILAGLVRLSEVQAGVVSHAIRVTFDKSQQGYIPPATHAAGAYPLGSAYPPMGLRLRLKSGTPTSGYSPEAQVIMTAMKTYGLIVADNGSDWFFQGDSDDGWNVTPTGGQESLVDQLVDDFRNLTGADFEAVYTGSPVATGL